MSLIADDRTNRIATPQVFERVAKLLKVEDFEPVLTLLVTKACLDQNQEVREAGSKAAVAIIKAQSERHANAILAILESFLDAEDGLAAKEESKNQACILLGTLAPFLHETSQKKLITTFDKLIELAYGCQSEMVRRSICKCIPQLSRYFPDKSKGYLQAQLKALKESEVQTELKGIAFVVAGLLKAQGMKVLNEMDIVGSLGREFFTGKKADPVRK